MKEAKNDKNENYIFPWICNSGMDNTKPEMTES
jgi:hypothetical protein